MLTRILGIPSLALLLLATGCADQNAPVTAAHPRDFALAHPRSVAPDLAACTPCHGIDLRGGSVVVSCFQCHAEGPPFRIHPASWTDPPEDHQNFAADGLSWTLCANAVCHGTDLQGGGLGATTTGPSCFSPSFAPEAGGSSSCHSGGPPAPHALPYSAPELHGGVAKANQHVCQNCHGRPGSDFDGGFVGDKKIRNRPNGVCSSTGCHPAAKAHPTDWQGSNDRDPTFEASHRGVSQATVDASCALCHNTTAPGSGPMAGAPSCFSRNHTNADGVESGCHADGPLTAPHALPFSQPGLHGPEAKKGFAFCQACHGTPGTTRFDGGKVNVPCSACHPSSGVHPTNWQGSDDTTLDYLSTHRNVALTTVAGNCGLCHNTSAAAAGPNPGAPSCYSTSHTNADGNTTGCHPNGPATPPHALPFALGPVHGPEAKKNLGFCQTCHGTPDTIAFDGGVVPTACSAAACHPAAGAHPTNWQGTDGATSHRSAGDLGTSCALCHDTAKDAPGPKTGAPSCFSASFTNPAGASTPCHPNGPGAPHALPYADPTLHGANAKADLAFCQSCHGAPGTTAFDGGVAQTRCSSPACHPDAGAHPSQWQGTNDPTPSYASTHRNASTQGTGCTLCHDVTKGRPAPKANAPSCFSASFTNPNGTGSTCHVNGPVTPHALPFAPGPVGNVSASLHGAEAKKDLTFCEQCHATPFNGGPGSNPRFNVLLGRLRDPGGRTGCEVCHKDRTAHPVPWAVGVIADHKEFGNKQVACALCHGPNLEGPADTPPGVGRRCTDDPNIPDATNLLKGCHRVKPLPPPAVACTSCHTTPPSGPNTPDNRPNRQGAHGAIHDALPRMDCNACHNGAGTGTAKHFDRAAPADILFLPAYNAKTGNAIMNDGTVAGRPAVTCSNVRCHGGVNTPNWYTGTINRSADCTSCHIRGTAAQSPQFNSPFSGRHNLGTHVFNGCTSCHDPVKLEPSTTRHYSGLDTPQFETDPATTIRDAVNYSKAPAGGATCNPSAGGLVVCHGLQFWQ